jgi:hypothetical protein
LRRSSAGAFDLTDASSEDPDVDAALSEARRRLHNDEKEPLSDYYVSIIEMNTVGGDADDATAGGRAPDSYEYTLGTSALASAAAAAAAASSTAAVAAAAAATSSFALNVALSEEDAELAAAAADAADSPRSVTEGRCAGDCLVLRLWHMDVFVGARESARGDPGSSCRDWHYGAKDAEFRHEMTLEQTDGILQKKEEQAKARENMKMFTS